MTSQIQTPEHAGARDQAQELARALGDRLAGHEVVLDCSRMLVGTPSYLDEIVKQILVERQADALTVVGASDRIQELIARAATNRGLRPRLSFGVRA